MANSTIQNTLADARQRLIDGTDTPGQDAQVLLAHILGKDRSWVLAHGEEIINQPQLDAFETALTALENGTPLPYILQKWEFYGLDFSLTPEVLIPRPETELLVERALDWLQNNPNRRTAADIGTGSGCIAVTLAKYIVDLSVFAMDISEQALQVARQNAERHGVSGQLSIFQSDLLDGVGVLFNLICANLPYIPAPRLPELKVSQHEPRLALDGGPDGLDLIERLLAQAPARLLPEGLILLEIDDSHAESGTETARQLFPKARIQVYTDLAGKPRLLEIEDRAG